MIVSKLNAWIMILIISIVEIIILYSGYNGNIQAILMPIIAYLFGIVTKTGVDKIIAGKGG